MQSSEMNQPHLLATIFFSLILGANAFSYKEAKNWGKKYPECNGKHQSPILIKPTFHEGPSYSTISQKLKLTDFHKLPTKMTIKNTGHTVEIKADWSGEPPRLTGGPLHGNYVFEKATFHWGKKNRVLNETITQDYSNDDNLYFKLTNIKGGEHKEYDILNATRPEDMEMHTYFYKTDFKSFEKAQSQKGGLAVFVEWLKSGFIDSERLFDKLEKSLHKVKNINSTARIPPFPVASFVERINSAITAFEFYEGSLDYPPCSESVTWFIDADDTPITDTLLKEFRKIKLAEGDVSNIRPIQALNDREVKTVYYE